MPTVRMSSSAIASSPTKPARRARRWRTARHGGSAQPTAGGVCSARRSPAPRPAGPGVPAHDDLVERDFTADALNRLWLADITEHPTGEGKIYLCAIKDVSSNRIVGYSIDSRMKSRLAVAALDNAVGRRGVDGGEVAGPRGRCQACAASLKKGQLASVSGQFRLARSPSLSRSRSPPRGPPTL